jgi:glyoxylase-like metal-dependent hydrolase (beta-lactamase superfamily II)
MLLAGDSLFVGKLARPDLTVEPEEGARGLFGSLGRLLELEDFVEVWPAHIGGSLCGGAGSTPAPATSRATLSKTRERTNSVLNSSMPLTRISVLSEPLDSEQSK